MAETTLVDISQGLSELGEKIDALIADRNELRATIVSVRDSLRGMPRAVNGYDFAHEINWCNNVLAKTEKR